MLSKSKVAITYILAEKLVYIQQSSGFLVLTNTITHSLQFCGAAESGKKKNTHPLKFRIEGGGRLFHDCILFFVAG